jgi:hypothetical protein
MIPAIISGCLGDKNGGSVTEGVSANSLRPAAESEVGNITGNLQLVVVTAMEPKDGGNSLSWKFAYNDMTSGMALGSYLITVDEDGRTETTSDDALSKSPIRNWTIDSITAYSKARSNLIDEGIITSRVSIKVQFLYLLGEDGDNNGCEWTLGLILGKESPLEVTVRVDGRFGNILEIIDPRN